MTGRNNCISYWLKNAITGTSPLFTINYPRVLVSRGDLTEAKEARATAGATGTVAFSWRDNSTVGQAKASDRALLVVHCPELHQSIYTTGGPTRSMGACLLGHPSFSGREIPAWLGFMAEDGSEVANSVYTGAALVA